MNVISANSASSAEAIIFNFDKVIKNIKRNAKYALKTKIFTKAQINCLKCIVSILSNANQCKLFDVYNDVEKTMFNYYLLEIIPILNSFYDKLVDMQLPNFIAELLEESKYNNKNIEYNFLFNYEEKKNKKCLF